MSEEKMNEGPSLLDFINIKSLLSRVLRGWYWFVLVFIIAVAGTFAKLRYEDEIYQVHGSILIKEDQTEQISLQPKDNGGMSALSSNSFIGDQIEILTSKRLMETVIRDLGMYKRMYTVGKIKKTEVYNFQPFIFKEHSDPFEFFNTTFIVEDYDSETFGLSINGGDTLLTYYGDTVQYENLKFSFEYIHDFENPVTMLVEEPRYLASFYARNLQVRLIKGTHILSLETADHLPLRSIDIMYRLVQNYNEYVLEFKNNATFRTLDFIDERLKFISKELFDVENDVEEFKKTNNITIQSDMSTRQVLDKLYKSDEDISSLEIEEQLLEELRKTIKKSFNTYNYLPSSLASSSGSSIAENISDYNNLVNERNRLLISAKEQNPVVRSIDKQLDLLKQTMLSSIDLTLSDLRNRTVLLESKIDPVEQQMKDIPKYERRLIQIMRQQKVKESLFTFLLQKREEYSMSLASEVNYTRIIDDPEIGLKIHPNGKRSYMVNAFLALMLPLIVFVLLEVLDDRVYDLSDVTRRSQAKIMGAVIRDERPDKAELTVKRKYDYSPYAEAFRYLRSNLIKEIEDNKIGGGHDVGKVLLITSARPGEGKTYVGFNLAASMALSGHSCVVINLDFRASSEQARSTGKVDGKGIANYLLNESTTIDHVLNPLAGIGNMFYIESGEIASNPVDYFTGVRMQKLFRELKSRFHYIILDTPPLGVVSDAFSLREYTDLSMCIVKPGTTRMSDLDIVKDINQNDKLPNFSVIVNGIEKTKNLYGNGGEEVKHPWYKFWKKKNKNRS